VPRKDLKNKPLVEALLELRWVLPGSSSPGLIEDPNYRILLGRFFERVKDDYPAHESLPTAGVPDSMVGHIAQHRFRTKVNGWPLVQLGPGLLTVNDTASYTWDDFQARCESVVARFVESHPAIADLRLDSLALRYIDAVAFDASKEDVFKFLRDKMKTNVALPTNLFDGPDVTPAPSTFTWQAVFPNRKPEGTVVLRFATGIRESQPVLLWETLVSSQSGQTPKIPEGFPQWLREAHDITDDWFFKLIEGELERRFSGE